MDDQTYMFATRRTDPEDGYAEDGAIALRLGRTAALLHYALGIVTEAGELADALKKAVIYGRDLDRVNLIEEIGDLQWYEARLLDHLGSSFGEARGRNIAKLRARYPDGFSEEDALVRDLGTEREILARRQPDGFDRAPEHYAGEREAIDVLRDKFGDRAFAIGCLWNAVKYELRAGRKGDPEGDAAKARWYREMAAHVEGDCPDPRSGRERFQPYQRAFPRGGLVPLPSSDRFSEIGRRVVTAIATHGAEDEALAHATPSEVEEHVLDLRNTVERNGPILDVMTGLLRDAVELLTDVGRLDSGPTGGIVIADADLARKWDEESLGLDTAARDLSATIRGLLQRLDDGGQG